MSQRIFKTRYFDRWARKAGLMDRALLKAVQEMAQGLVDADLGGGLVKKRVPLPGRGKRGGARTLIALERGERCFFLYGFEKNEMENIEAKDLRAWKQFASLCLGLTEEELKRNLESAALVELAP